MTEATGRRSYYIVVEGAIGVGKTTLVRELAERLQARTAYEIFEENPFLSDFYADRDRYAFQTEMFFLLSRYRQQEAFAQADLFAPYAISDYLFEKSRLFARETLNEDEFTLFDHMFQILAGNIPTPDLVVYLKAPLPVLLERIARRGRDYERHIDAAYLEGLGGVYDDYFARLEDVPLITVDTTTLNFADDPLAVELVLEAIHEPPSGRRFLSGAGGQLSML